MHRKVAIFDELGAPDLPDDLVPRDQLARPPDEHLKNVHRLRSQIDPLPIPRQPPLNRVVLKIPKPKDTHLWETVLKKISEILPDFHPI